MVIVGKYVTVWSKQADDSWKVQVDSFNTNEPSIAAEESWRLKVRGRQSLAALFFPQIKSPSFH